MARTTARHATIKKKAPKAAEAPLPLKKRLRKRAERGIGTSCPKRVTKKSATVPKITPKTPPKKIAVPTKPSGSELSAANALSAMKRTLFSPVVGEAKKSDESSARTFVPVSHPIRADDIFSQSHNPWHLSMVGAMSSPTAAIPLETINCTPLSKQKNERFSFGDASNEETYSTTPLPYKIAPFPFPV